MRQRKNLREASDDYRKVKEELLYYQKGRENAKRKGMNSQEIRKKKRKNWNESESGDQLK